MLQNIMAGFDILGVGVVLGSLALLWGFWKVLRDDLDLENASPHRREPKPKPAEMARKAGKTGTVSAVPEGPEVEQADAAPAGRLDHSTAA